MSGAATIPVGASAAPGERALAGLRLRLALAAFLEAQQGRLFAWAPVALGAGIAAYFALGFEPAPAWRLAALGLGLAAALLAWRLPAARAAAGLPAAALLGLALAGWHAARQPPMPDLPRGATILSGTVLRVDPLPEGRRVTLAEARLDGGAPLARQVRVRLRKEDPAEPRPGDGLVVRALVRAPAPPAYPGAWDFQRAAWFSGLAGSGFAIGPAAVQPDPEGRAPPLAGLRSTIEARVAAALPGTDGAAGGPPGSGAVRPSPEGAIAAALIAGGQSAIPPADLAAMRDSGLAHILSVSGMHIAIVMGLVFGLLRLLLAAIPPLALRLPVKAVAALAALAAGGFYMLLTGTQVPMQRSFAMAALATIALLAGRRALTFRAWALAALVVLAVEPVALLGPSFQMSFAAVLALIAGWQALRPHLAGRQRSAGLGERAALLLAGIVATSVLAGLATAPYALHHFGRVQLYGVAANALAAPLVSLVVMPAGMAAAALMPLGLEQPALTVMGWGILGMLAVARWVASWPGAAFTVAPIPAWSLALATAGLLVLCLVRGRTRLLGLPLAAGGILAGVLLARPPDLLVSADGRLVAARLEGAVHLQRLSGASALTRDAWLRHWGAAATEPFPERGEAAGGRLSCTPGACTLRHAPEANPAVVLLRGDPPAEACRAAALVVSAEPVRGRCGAAVVDRFAVWRNGAHAVWLTPAGPVVVSDRAWRGARPWVPPPPVPRGGGGPREPPAAVE